MVARTTGTDLLRRRGGNTVKDGVEGARWLEWDSTRNWIDWQ